MATNGSRFNVGGVLLPRVELQPSCQQKITTFATWLQNNSPDALVALDGHEATADDSDPGLAAQRVSAVRDALVAAGLKADRISIGAYGAQAEVCHYTAETCRDLNRRVEILARQ
jgi:outer membrane protein OmpA-like peptidoglycan-associated protein